MSIEKKSAGVPGAVARPVRPSAGATFARKIDADRYLATVTVDTPRGRVHRP